MAKRRTVSFLQAAIPVERGPAAHFERQDDLAMTVFRNNECEEIHTPQDVLRRIHETLHARHSPTGGDQGYISIRPEVKEIIEDCRLHLNHWPWVRSTPTEISDAITKTLKQELKQAESLEGYADFATRLRARAVYQGIGSPGYRCFHKTNSEKHFMNT